MEIRPLNPDLIWRANSNSFGGKRGDLSNKDYHAYADEILGWPISDDKKSKLLDKLHEKFSEKLRYEAQHVSAMVAGPARYNAKRLDKSDTILRLSAEFCDWFDELRRQVENGTTRGNDKVAQLIEMILFCDERPELDPTTSLAKLAVLDNAKFVEIYEKLRDKYKWRKNSTIYKLYEKSIAGEVQEIKKEIVAETPDFTAYTEGDRAYIKFIMRPQRQLIFALKSRGWWWNSLKGAWSTHLNKADWEWVKTIGTRYAAYV